MQNLWGQDLSELYDLNKYQTLPDTIRIQLVYILADQGLSANVERGISINKACNIHMQRAIIVYLR